MELLIFLVIWGGLAWGVGALAESRGRSLPGFFLLSLFLSPLLGLIIVLVTPNLTEREQAEAERDRLRREEHERQLEEIRALAPTAQPEGPPSSVADELEKLASLRERGFLTDDEFEAQKAAVLGPR